MKKAIVTKDGIQLLELTASEMEEIERQNEQEKFNDILIPLEEDIKEAEFELKTINLLIKLGVL